MGSKLKPPQEIKTIFQEIPHKEKIIDLQGNLRSLLTN